MYPSQLIECIPNFSEGRDATKIAAIAAAIRETPGVALLHVDVSPAANRTVMTFAGAPQNVVGAAFNAIQKATQLIDMRTQAGVHPRIGATDVCPLVPLQHITMDEVVAWSKKLGERVGTELDVPVYMYEHSSGAAHRTALPDIRRGQYEGLSEKIQQREWVPDYGPATLHAAAGATVIGARNILLAFNVSLNTKDINLAQSIAGRIRESGYTLVANGKKQRIAGLFPKVRAIGWYMEDYEQAQVSMNLLDYHISSPVKVYGACAAMAAEEGAAIAGSEVIGLIPEACLLEAGAASYLQKGIAPLQDKTLLIAEGMHYMQLNKLKDFNPQEKILEYTLDKAFNG